MSNGLINDMDSCELCKLRKVKCDRVEPTCGWCARNERVCEYKERKKPGLRAGYGRELEGRIDRLEALIHAQGSRLDDHIHKHATSDPARSTTLSGTPSMEVSRHGDFYGMIPKGLPYASVASSGWPQVHGSEHGQYSQQPEGVFDLESLRKTICLLGALSLQRAYCPRYCPPMRVPFPFSFFFHMPKWILENVQANAVELYQLVALLPV
jgi:hypothetical protein